ncbi:MAG TPA: exo-alpha-sialidase [Thermoanaerobaculia bacterium]
MSALLLLVLLAAGGLSSQPLHPPAGPGAMAPNVALAGDDVLLTWLEPAGKGRRLQFSRLSGGRWSAPVTIASGPLLLANWADFPGAVQAADGSLVAHWLETRAPDVFEYSPRLAVSNDGGKTWKPMGRLPTGGGDQAEYGFVAWVPEGKGARGFWLDGRDLPGDERKGAMALRTAKVQGKPGGEERLDAKVCSCCQTDAALAAGGPVIAYRDRSDQEIRDISVIRRTAQGWSQPVRVHADNWKIPGCPVNGPAIAASGKRVAVAWFTGAPPNPRVQVAFSEDGGATFGPPALVDANKPIGRVDLVLDADGGAIVSWAAADGDGAEIRLRRVGPKGGLGAPRAVAATSAARSSGFPRMVRNGDRIVLAWVEGQEPSTVRAAAIPLAAVR